MNQENLSLIERWWEMQTAHDMSKLEQIFTPDVIYEDLAIEAKAVGYTEIKELFKSIYVSMPDYNIKLVSALADEERGGGEFLMSGTHVGDFPDLPGTGKPFAIRAASAMRFANGRVTHWHDYWSVTTFKKQVGLE